MIWRIIAALFLAWIAGFVWFASTLPGAGGDGKTDAVVVPTGGAGRIAQGIAVLQSGQAKAMLVTGVDRHVKPGEFAAEFKVPVALMKCCITLGFGALDTRGNADETAQWARKRKLKSLRLVTTDWHMRRAAAELHRALPADIKVVRDAVRSEPSAHTLFVEYNKLLAVWLTQGFD